MLPYKSLIQLNRDSNVALYIQLCNSFIKLITTGALQPSDVLPSTRVLSELIGLNRNTVKLAYEELMSQGWAESVERKGIYVLSKLPILLQKKKTNFEESIETPNEGFSWTNPFKERQIEENYQQSLLTIDDGFPDVRLTPIDLLMREYRSISKKFYGKNYLKYGFPEGSENLRSALSRYLSNTRGLVVNPENLLITKGSQMGIYLAAQLLLKESDNIAVGVSNYRSADEIFTYTGANLIRIPVDEHGMDIDILEEIVKKKTIKAVYIIPHHHFPTTVTMSMERRLKLLKLAKEYQFAIIEDDYDFDFHYDAKPYIPLASIDHNRNVIYIGSITKTFAPALRIGFMVAQPSFVKAASSLRRLIDKQGDSLLEEAFSSLFDNGEMERHFRKSLKIYKHRRDLFCEILQSNFNDVIEFKIPEGGLAVWSVFDPSINLQKLSTTAKKKGLKISDGSFYNNEAYTPNGLRLGFASLNEKEIEKSLELLRIII
ncbi:GntR family transcriptional regulator/MocR family aminotransferase [Chryseobacterium ginsenosidimutans]|uniref:MocR-like pyridoxine biosynthesis transcription factor PdxR n=1 Tax=Chryseobacterium ginsenosidimutans TaxID=687846 RepID=UPI002167DA9F|nr:PLP-dependent aminotransferase family protein [Chryseobacterium ginsenosidimutans]MCS3870316.1 GntR family transcriptional regulator/MocR family aminotransferase [Chryseobacterium ginsenosidimutans]